MRDVECALPKRRNDERSPAGSDVMSKALFGFYVEACSSPTHCGREMVVTDENFRRLVGSAGTLCDHLLPLEWYVRSADRNLGDHVHHAAGH